MTVHKKSKKNTKTFFDSKTKTNHVLKFKTSNFSYRYYSQQYSIPSSSLSDWVKEYDASLANGREPFQNSVGKPSFLGEKEVWNWSILLKKRKKVSRALKNHNWFQLLSI
jgi:hypothetical protein